MSNCIQPIPCRLAARDTACFQAARVSAEHAASHRPGTPSAMTRSVFSSCCMKCHLRTGTHSLLPSSICLAPCPAGVQAAMKQKPRPGQSVIARTARNAHALQHDLKMVSIHCHSAKWLAKAVCCSLSLAFPFAIRLVLLSSGAQRWSRALSGST